MGKRFNRETQNSQQFQKYRGTGRETPPPLVLVLVGEGSNFMWRKKVTAAKLGVHGNDKTEKNHPAVASWLSPAATALVCCQSWLRRRERLSPWTASAGWQRRTWLPSPAAWRTCSRTWRPS